MPRIIDLIPAEPAKSSLLTGSKPIRVRWADGELHTGWDRGEWPTALSWTPECPIPVSTFPNCFGRTDPLTGLPYVEPDKPASNPITPPCVLPFWVQAGEICGTDGVLTVGEHLDRLDRALAARLPRRVAEVLWTGNVNGIPQVTLIDGVPCEGASLQNTATVVSLPLGATPAAGYVPSNPNLVISGLLAAFEECDGAAIPTFHFPWAVLPFLCESGCLDRVGDHWMLYGEYPAIFGPGYPGTPPIVPPPNGPIPPAGPGQAWVYVTGPVFHAVSEWTKYLGIDENTSRDEYAAADFSQMVLNQVELHAEKLAVVAFDPCCVFAGLMEYC